MKRIQWLDDLKGLAIVLIVAGHVVATLGNMTTGVTQSLMQSVFDFVYLFHVPLFFVVAGLTFSAKDGFAVFAKKKFFRLMVPYYVWGFISAAIYIVMGQGVAADMQSVATTTSFADKTLHGAWWVPLVSILHAGTWPDGKGFCFNGVLWFLPVMFAVLVAYYGIARLCRSSTQLLFSFAFLLVALIWLYPYTYGIRLSAYAIRYFPFNVMRVLHYLPFVALGHWFSCRFLRQEAGGEKPSGRLPLAIAVILLSYCVLAWFLPVARKDSAFWVKWFVRALPMIVVLMAAARFGILHGFGFLAPLTLGIMLFHKFPLVIAQIAIGRSHLLQTSLCQHFPLVAIASLSLLLTVALTFFCYAFSKMIVRYAPWSLGSLP